MELLQLVKVKKTVVTISPIDLLHPLNCTYCILLGLYTLTAVFCAELASINNGSIAYSPDIVAPFDNGTTASYSCNEGLYLEGNQMRTCQGDDSSLIGTWSGMSPVCAGLCS